MHNPVSTYRFQFHKNFTFSHFQQIIPYIHHLGISTIYASPIFEATPGSTHGYDVVNPLRINPEIGTLEQLYQIRKTLAGLNINWLQDIVPNHMAFDQKNEWLMDVLEKGRRSAFADYFDILWDNPTHNGKTMVPFLGSSLDEVINQKELKVALQDDKLVFSYGGQNYPLNLQNYSAIIRWGDHIPEVFSPLLAAIAQLDSVGENDYAKQYDSVKKELTAAISKNRPYLKNCLEAINNNPDLLRRIADGQEYRLCFWQDTNSRINYRRFFTVNGLICLNIHHPHVFDHYHQLIKKLLADGVFQGLRVDHIDGLYDPQAYLEKLRRLTGDETYIIVEKILESGEAFPSNWPVQGNTGYDFLSIVNNLFTNVDSKKAFSKFYREIIRKKERIDESIHDKKSLILNQYMGGELENLTQLFLSLDLIKEAEMKEVSEQQLKAAVGAILIWFPVYRFYGNHFPLNAEESEALQQVFKSIRKNDTGVMPAIDLIEKVLLKNTQTADIEYNKRALRFYQRLMQFSGPLMAKGVEDTLMYTYDRFIDHNEVGDSPESFGITIPDYHQMMTDRRVNWPLTMSATSTHDTKRGEDVRARLNVLTDMPDEWIAVVRQWRQVNADLKTNNAPDDNDEYFIYQTIAGAYPMPGEDEDDFTGRLQEYLVKAFREGKRKSNWAEPDEQYEEAARKFVVGILNPESEFWKSFSPFHQKICDYGIVNSLGQALLKYTSPGMPDLYQGCELWDLSLVDPDNRRPVDYERRSVLLDQIKNNDKPRKEFWQQLWQTRYNAHIKLSLINTLLNECKHNSEVFSQGEYLPLKVKGKYKDNVLAFARRYQKEWYVVALPLQLASLNLDNQDIATFNWGDTKIVLPLDAPAAWQQLFLGTDGNCDEFIKIADIFKVIPIALLKLKQPDKNRGAGILMHITSLPSAFAVGDMGTEAYLFADFLNQGRQKYWQMLPVNPTDPHAWHSPYSSTSSVAGNPLLISPEQLVQDGFLQNDEIQPYKLSADAPADYEKAAEIRESIFETAFHHFLSSGNTSRQQEFKAFKTSEAYWLDDYALYQVIKNNHNNAPWYQWPDEYKLRNAAALGKFAVGLSAQLEKIRWLQYIFSNQWNSLKLYCNKKGIDLLGDMPFYVSYDSADVWANPELFNLDDDGAMAGIAGVPPDYFSAQGQLWGMPVYNWDKLKNTGYRWWLNRIKRNLAYFDLIRLDHFRAFADYWEVPGGETTAVNGTWKLGPGADFFRAIEKEMGSLPFVAEDLGEVNDDVYKLRDDFKLPGMRVLQFGFDDEMPHSMHIPHNYTENSFAYTGTHDNNTTVGWYNQITKAERKRIAGYLDKKLSAGDVHQVLLKACYASIANVAIIPMQDILGLDEKHRMNLPSSTDGNWAWRLKPDQLTKKLAGKLRSQVILYNR